MADKVSAKPEIPTSETRITIHMPNTIGIEMVQANELRHYEMFQWLVSLMLPIAVGFWTGYFTISGQNKALLWSAVIFSLLSILFVVLAVVYRRKLYHGSITKSASWSDFQ